MSFSLRCFVSCKTYYYLQIVTFFRLDLQSSSCKQHFHLQQANAIFLITAVCTDGSTPNLRTDLPVKLFFGYQLSKATAQTARMQCNCLLDKQNFQHRKSSNLNIIEVFPVQSLLKCYHPKHMNVHFIHSYLASVHQLASSVKSKRLY